VLWPGAQPPGAVGRATMGPNWDVGRITSPATGESFVSPQIAELRCFDLLDRGLNPAQAVDWLHSNGYNDDVVWYPEPAVLAFRYTYIAFVNGLWELVIRVGG